MNDIIIPNNKANNNNHSIEISNHHHNDNDNDNGNDNDIANDITRIAFAQFVSFVKSLDLHPEIKWKSQLRKESYEKLTQKRRIISMELQHIDCKDPLTIIVPLYQKDKYSIELFSKALSSISMKELYTQESIASIIETKEKMEMIRKITEYYLNYLAINYSDRIIQSYNNLHFLEASISESHALLYESTQKMKAIKSHLIVSSAQLALKHNKMSNLQSMLKFLKEVFLNQIASLNQLKLEQSEYLSYYKKNIALQNSLSKISSDYPMIHIIDLMKAKCRKMNEGFTKQFLYDIEVLFDKKKSNIYDLFCLYSIISQVGLSNEAILSFSSKVLTCYKEKIKSIIKKTFFLYAEEKNNHTLESMLSIKDIKKLKYEEEKFLEGFKMTLVYLKDLNEMYLAYTQIEEKSDWGVKLKKELIEKQDMAYTILEKIFTKLISSMNFILRGFGNKATMLVILDMICLFEELSKKQLNVTHSKFLPLSVKNLILDQIKFDNIRNIKKIGVLLSGDMWQKTELEDSIDLFFVEKIEEKTPLFLRNYLTIFNDVKEYVNRDNIDEVFNHCFKIGSSSHDRNRVNINDFYLEKKREVITLSKPLNIPKLILSSSSISIIRALFDLVRDLVFYDSIVFEIFFQIFNIIDYFMLSSLNMFIITKKRLNSLFDMLNYDEIKQRSQISQASSQIKLQMTYSNFRTFLIATKKKLEVLFQQKEGIDLEKNCSDFNNTHDMNKFYLPKLNQLILDSDGNVNSGNYNASNIVYESMLLLETIRSIYKILKRLAHFSTKIELDFQSGFINDTIKRYKVIIKEMKDYMFYHLSSELFRIDSIQAKILDFKWDPDESEAEEQLFEASPFVKSIIDELKAVNNKIGSKINKYSNKLQRHFIMTLVQFIMESLMDCFAKIKKCNSTGRSIMLKDLKFLKQSLEDIVNKTWNYTIPFDKHFNEIFTYVNAWYYDKEEMIQYVFDNKIEYKYWIGLYNTSKVIKDLSWSQRRELNQKMEEGYYDSIRRNIAELNDL